MFKTAHADRRIPAIRPSDLPASPSRTSVEPDEPPTRTALPRAAPPSRRLPARHSRALAPAAALVPEPAILVPDEPFNGLDPHGIRIMRDFLRRFTDDGGTVFLSSHLLAAVAQSADDAIIIDHGRLVNAGPIGAITTTPRVMVTTADAELLAVALEHRGAGVSLTSIGQTRSSLPPAVAPLVLLGWVAGVALTATRIALGREPR